MWGSLVEDGAHLRSMHARRNSLKSFHRMNYRTDWLRGPRCFHLKILDGAFAASSRFRTQIYYLRKPSSQFSSASIATLVRIRCMQVLRPSCPMISPSRTRCHPRPRAWSDPSSRCKYSCQILLSYNYRQTWCDRLMFPSLPMYVPMT